MSDLQERFAEALQRGMEAAKRLEEGEPEYRFVKGQGWVSSYEPPYPTRTDIIGNYRVTFEQRDPVEGENFFLEAKFKDKRTVDTLANHLVSSDYWQRAFRNSLDFIKRQELPMWVESEHGYHKLSNSAELIVLIVEPV